MIVEVLRSVGSRHALLAPSSRISGAGHLQRRGPLVAFETFLLYALVLAIAFGAVLWWKRETVLQTIDQRSALGRILVRFLR